MKIEINNRHIDIIVRAILENEKFMKELELKLIRKFKNRELYEKNKIPFFAPFTKPL